MNLTPKRRKAIYSVLVAVGGLLVVYGIVAESQVAAWLAVVEAALLAVSNGLAAKNTPSE